MTHRHDNNDRIELTKNELSESFALGLKLEFGFGLRKESPTMHFQASLLSNIQF